jgi:hypothetical protein
LSCAPVTAPSFIGNIAATSLTGQLALSAIPAAATNNGTSLTNLQIYPNVTNGSGSAIWILTTNAGAVTWWLATNNLPIASGGGGSTNVTVLAANTLIATNSILLGNGNQILTNATGYSVTNTLFPNQGFSHNTNGNDTFYSNVVAQAAITAGGIVSAHDLTLIGGGTIAQAFHAGDANTLDVFYGTGSTASFRSTADTTYTLMLLHGVSFGNATSAGATTFLPVTTGLAINTNLVVSSLTATNAVTILSTALIPTNAIIAWTGTATNWTHWVSNGVQTSICTNVNQGGFISTYP